MFELYPSNKFILRGEDYTVCTRGGVCVVKLQPGFGAEFWILGDVFIEVGIYIMTCVRMMVGHEVKCVDRGGNGI